MTVLLVVAHPDDEVLGAGGTAATLAQSGVAVSACILSGNVDARRNRPELGRLRRDAERASELLGMGPPAFGDFPNIGMNAVPHIELVRFIEASIERTQASSLLTHHPADLNDDHLQTSRACQAAARLFQRKPGVEALVGVHFMEVLSSTDWAFSKASVAFAPNTFVPITEAALGQKLAALSSYDGVMRPPPHSRSEETVRALARYRGSQAGTVYAEAFETIFRCSSAGNFVVGRS